MCGRRGMSLSGPLDLNSTAEIRSGVGEGDGWPELGRLRRLHGRSWPEFFNRATPRDRAQGKSTGLLGNSTRAHLRPRLEPRTSDSSSRRQTADVGPEKRFGDS